MRSINFLCLTEIFHQKNGSISKQLKLFNSHFILQLSLLLCFCLLAHNIRAAVTGYKPEDDARFKAAFIYNFAKFTNWPEASFKKNEPLVLCTTSKKGSGFNLNRLSGKTIKGRPLFIQPLESNHTIDKCHMLYIEKSLKNKYKNLLKLTYKKPILTVSDIPAFANKGGIIQFYRKKGQTHLIINLDIARESNLEISSRLLILAEVISSRDIP